MESTIFRDSIEHIEALEYSARLRLATAYLRSGKNPIQSDRKTASLSDQTCTKRLAEARPDFRFSDLSSGGTALDELETLLEEVEIETEQRAKESIRQGIDLNFERLCESYDLDLFERRVVGLLIANNTSRSFMDLYAQCEFDPHNHDDGSMSIGTLLSLTTHSLRDQIAGRRYFSIGARLISHEIIIPWQSYDNTTNILDVTVHLHERIVRYILGDNNTYDTEMQFISKQRSTVELDQVILPGALKEEVYELAKNYSNSRSRKERTVIDRFYGYGTGLTLLFHGPSGTGKTMLAHALAHSLDNELLTLNMEKASKARASLEDLIRSIFKEAKLCGGIVFFDECDDVFYADSSESRTLLIQIEKAECITILATNKVVELDPSLDRRISMKAHFKFPGETEREDIWKALVPPGISLSKDIDFKKLAAKYIFTGGLIKNALFMAATNALTKTRGPEAMLTVEEVEKAANCQTTSMFELNGFGNLYTPRVSIADLCIRGQDKMLLSKLASVYKGLGNRDAGMVLAIGSSDIHTGITCVDAMAKECQLKVKSFSLSDLIGKGSSPEYVRDPLTQEKISPIDYAFRTLTGHKCLTMFVDHRSSFEQFISKEREELEDGTVRFLNRLREVQGLFFLVTTPFKQDALPVEFDKCIEIHPPTEELQIRQWEQHLRVRPKINSHFQVLRRPRGKTREGRVAGYLTDEQRSHAGWIDSSKCEVVSGRALQRDSATGDEIVRLVERYPMHLHEIEFIVKKANMNSLLKGSKDTITINDVHEALTRFKKKKGLPLLFGAHDLS